MANRTACWPSEVSNPWGLIRNTLKLYLSGVGELKDTIDGISLALPGHLLLDTTRARGFEVFVDTRKIEVATFDQDAFTEAVADGFFRVCVDAFGLTTEEAKP